MQTIIMQYTYCNLLFGASAAKPVATFESGYPLQYIPASCISAAIRAIFIIPLISTVIIASLHTL